VREQIEKRRQISLVLRLESRGRVAPSVLCQELKLAFDHFEDVKRIALVRDAVWQEAFAKVSWDRRCQAKCGTFRATVSTTSGAESAESLPWGDETDPTSIRHRLRPVRDLHRRGDE
jgi:hypothetical protein